MPQYVNEETINNEKNLINQHNENKEMDTLDL